MRRARCILRVLASAISLSTLGSLAVFGGSSTSQLALSGVRDGLRRSPDLYVAAVLEVIGKPQCTDPQSSATCVEKARLVEVLASHGGVFKTGDVIVFSNAGTTGTRYLAFLVPIKSRPDLYGSTFLGIGASDEDRKRFAAELIAAGLKPGA